MRGNEALSKEARTAEEAARLCTEALAHSPRDIPFGLVYLLDAEGARLRLAGHTGLEPGTAASPLIAEIADVDAAGWPLGRVLEEGPATVGDLAARFDCLPKAPSNQPPRQAVLMPLARPGAMRAAGVIVFGVSPERALDDDYRGLFGLVATHIAIAVSSARACEEENERARQLEETRAALLKDVERKNEELGAFSYSISHDLRAPLRSIQGFSQALVEDQGDRLDDDGKDHLRRVRAAAQRMDGLIEDLLQLSRIDRAALKREKVDLSALAVDVVDGLRRSAPEREVVFVVQPHITVDADARLVRVVLEHLIGNAWKFTAKTAGPRIEVGSVEQGGRGSFFVRDNGAGFNPEYASKLFAPFQRLHAESEFPGTGVGLAMVQRIVSRHGGRVWAKSAPNEGATFSFTLP